MKNIVFTLLSLMAISAVAAQEDSSAAATSDTTKLRVGKKRFFMTSAGTKDADNGKLKKAEAYWSGIGIGVNMLAQRDGDLSLPRKFRQWENEPIRSLTWNLNFADVFIPLTKDRHSFGLVCGGGITYRSFSFVDDDKDIFTDRDTTYLSSNIDGRTYEKRKFRITYLSVPLLVSINTSAEKKENFHLSTGVIANLRLGSLYKQKYTENSEERKVRTRDDFNLNPISFDFTVRAGYRGATLFFNYGLTPLFKKGTGPELIPLTFGIQL